METTDAFRARFEANYFNLLIKKGVDPSTARTRAKAKAAARAEHGRHFYEQCVRPAPKGESYASCRQQWAAAMEPRTESEQGGRV